MSIKFSASSPSQGSCRCEGRRAGISGRAGRGAPPADRRARALASVADLGTQLLDRHAQYADRRSVPRIRSTNASNTLTNLINERSDDESQVSQLQAQIDQALTEEQSSGSHQPRTRPSSTSSRCRRRRCSSSTASRDLSPVSPSASLVVMFSALFSEGVPRPRHGGRDARCPCGVEPRALSETTADAATPDGQASASTGPGDPHDRTPATSTA